MRFNRYIREEDSVQSALDIDEPEIGEKYSERVISQNKKSIENAISKVGDPNDDAEEAILSDLEDKLEKWNNVEKEIEAVGPFPEDGEEDPPEEDPPEEDDEEEDKKKINEIL